jgi:hypothetical protein
MANNKTTPAALPPGTDHRVTRAMEDYSYQVMDAQTANNRVGPGSDKNK